MLSTYYMFNNYESKCTTKPVLSTSLLQSSSVRQLYDFYNNKSTIAQLSLLFIIVKIEPQMYEL